LHSLDWTILIITLLTIICYGIYKSKATKDLDGYFRSNKQLPWFLVLLSIMGTQASAITFISAPGQAFNDGMRFVQYYFGLPLAMIVICITFVPIFHKLNLFTAYEFLQKRFDKRTRTFAAFIFLLGRGLSTGISVVAPSIVLSYIFGWDIHITNVLMGGVLIIYTVSGGAKAVAYTQQLQFVIIILGMALAGYYAVHLLPNGVGFKESIQVAEQVGKMNIITTGMNAAGQYNWNDKYNIFSGIIGGFFLALSYFGTDQSQVGRYLTAKSIRETRISLLLNGLLKVPMQFLILLVGILVFSFYQYNKAPINFYSKSVAALMETPKKDSAVLLIQQYDIAKQKLQLQLTSNDNKDSAIYFQKQANFYKNEFKGLGKRQEIKIMDDANFIFLQFVTDHLPIGIVGLLIAMIFLASWGSIAAALNSLASSTLIDVHKQYSSKELSSKEEYKLSKQYTLAWGLFSILAAQFATTLGSLIEAVNVLGSLFYGVMLGLFLVAFYIKYIKARAVFWSAVISQLLIFVIYFVLKFEGFLWLNLIGVTLVISIGLLLQILLPNKKKSH
jgi:solute:Na+ symporter, SSS family